MDGSDRPSKIDKAVYTMTKKAICLSIYDVKMEFIHERYHDL